MARSSFRRLDLKTSTSCFGFQSSLTLNTEVVFTACIGETQCGLAPPQNTILYHQHEIMYTFVHSAVAIFGQNDIYHTITVPTMKTLVVGMLCCLLFSSSFAQTNATEFSCNDCTGKTHDLFAELDAGKVIVLCWVMPCGSCTGPSMTSHNVVKSLQATYPGRVCFYLIDDYANTTCSSLGGWANGYYMPESAFSMRFSNGKIKMSDYGEAGMPKIAAVGGKSHSILYNSNGTVDATALLKALNTELQSSSDVTTQDLSISTPQIFPNPADQQIHFSFSADRSLTLSLDVVNLMGQPVCETRIVDACEGSNSINLGTSQLVPGSYFLRLHRTGGSMDVPVIIEH